MADNECRETGHHKWDNPAALRSTCERCHLVRRAVKVAPFRRGFRRVHAHLRWMYEYPTEGAQ